MSAIQCGSETSFENFDLQMQPMPMVNNDPTQYSNLIQRFDQEKEILWLSMNPKGRQCFSVDLLKDMRAQHETLLNNHGTYLKARTRHCRNVGTFWTLRVF